MAFQTRRVSLMLILFLLNYFPSCQSFSAHNLQTLYSSSPPSYPPVAPPSAPTKPTKHSTSDKSIVTGLTAVSVTSASTLAAAALMFCLCTKCVKHKKKERTSDSSEKVFSSFNNQVHPKDDHQLNLQAAGNPGDQESQQVPIVDSSPPPPPPPPPPAPPPLPPNGGGASSRPPLAPKRSQIEASEDKTNQVKLKPLHWEKVNVVNRGHTHSMVWDKIEHGSFQYNADMIEILFGNSSAVNKIVPNPDAKIFILDSRRSQNTAIVIRSLGGTSTQKLIDGLLEGKGLNIEILEKLTRMTPTIEEKIKILSFDGEIRMLADADFFLYNLLKAVPSAFTRVNAMLFRYTYDSEIQYMKDSLQALDSACTELRSPRVFLKLLEATLKAGNRLNDGTSRGDAKAFNLTTLHKLSDYKSSDGKTTLLHFVVQEVVRSEGRRSVINRNNCLSWSNRQKSPSSNATSVEWNSKEDMVTRNEGSNSPKNPSPNMISVESMSDEVSKNIESSNQENPSLSTATIELKTKEDEVVCNEGSYSQSNPSSNLTSCELRSKEGQEKEFMILGLPIIGGLSLEFSNVKKAATFDYDTLSNISSSLEAHIAETSQLVLQCEAENGQGEFIKEMKEFLQGAEGQIKAIQEEQSRVMEFVKTTTQYYQSGGYKDKQPLKLFSIVNEFLAMVDKACVEITRSLQEKKSSP